MSEYTIYSISCKNKLITDCYVGATQNLTIVIKTYKYTYNNKKDRHYSNKLNTFIRNNKGWENWEIIILATPICVNMCAAYVHKRFYYEKLNSTLNSNYPLRSDKDSHAVSVIKHADKIKENRIKNADKIKEYYTDWYANNYEKLQATRKIYYEKNIDKRKLDYKINIDKIKEGQKIYYEKNIDKIKKYRTLNADKIKAQQFEVKMCDCGKTYTHQHYARHCKTKFHLSHININ
tara:strand:- start:14 stop:715 length:702 start_codon:yes stop_codon:yes gene_type:complete